jgi:hypothetical protein
VDTVPDDRLDLSAVRAGNGLGDHAPIIQQRLRRQYDNLLS